MHCKFGFALITGAAIIAAMCCAAIADDSAMSIINGGTVEPMDEHSSICMVREVVDIKLGARVGNDWPSFVRCQFEFRNDGPAVDANMGFPENARAEGEASASGRLKGFKSWVDGEPVAIEYLPSSKNLKSPREDYVEKYKAWYVKKVHFNAGQTRRVVVVYSTRLGFFNTVMSPDGTTFYCGYILRTGANWKGPIEEAIINADTSAAGADYAIHASPSRYKVGKNLLTWKFTDFEPKEDIEIKLIQKFPLLNGKPLEDANPWEPCFKRNGVQMASPEAFSNVEAAGKTCTIKHGRHTLKVHGGSKTAILDGKKITLAHAAWQGIRDCDFAVPLEEIVRLLGGSVKRTSSGRLNVVM